MKFFRRCLLLLLCCVLSLTAFSSVVSAENNLNYRIKVTNAVYQNGSLLRSDYEYIHPFDNVQQSIDLRWQLSSNITLKHLATYSFENFNVSPLFEKDKEVDLTISNIKYLLSLIYNYDNSEHFYRDPSKVRILLKYTNGNMEYIDDIDCTTTNNSSNYKNIACSFTPSYNVSSFEVIFEKTMSIGNVSTVYLTYTGEDNANDITHLVSFKQASDEVGLLKGLGNILSNIFEFIKEIPSKIWGVFETAFSTLFGWLSDIAEFLGSLIDRILELPQKLWTLIENGLKFLFIPSEDSLQTAFENVRISAESKFGALYQVGSIIFDTWTDIVSSDEQDTINIPKTTIPLPQNNNFSFGGYDVLIVPNGFKFLSDALKVITGILATVYFMNSLRNRYDRIVR